MAEKSKIRRSLEERIAALDQKIKFHKEKIDLLEKQKKEVLSPPQKKRSKAETLNEIYKAAKASGKSLDDILNMLKHEE
jgi:uncharacterized protein (UPF0179 family)